MGEPRAILRSVLADFPAVDHALAYGSGVFAQPGLYDGAGGGHGTAGGSGAAAGSGGGARAAAADRPMLDFIFAVEDPVAWHAANLDRHPQHYSFLRWFGPAALTVVAEGVGAGVYFNTLVPWRPHQVPGPPPAALTALPRDRPRPPTSARTRTLRRPPLLPAQLIKYGVVRLAALQHDLLHWSSLYCAGRLHKPVATLRQHAALAPVQAANLASALRVALLLLPPRFATLDLLHAVCAISYSGDVRMGLAEDSRKVHRIVAGSEAGLRQLYAAPLAAAQQRWRLLEPTGGDAWARDDSPAAAAQLAAGLPTHVLERLAAPLGLPAVLPEPGGHLPGAAHAAGQQAQRQETLAAVGRALAAAAPERRQRLLRHAIHAIVGASSRRQAVSGVLTAGLAKSARYGWAKLRKAWR